MEESVIRSDPNRTLIPSMVVDAVCHVPYASHPSYAQGYYDRDNEFYLQWDVISKSSESVEGWLDEWVYGVADRAEYWAKLGEENHRRLEIKSEILRRRQLRGLLVTRLRQPSLEKVGGIQYPIECCSTSMRGGMPRPAALTDGGHAPSRLPRVNRWILAPSWAGRDHGPRRMAIPRDGLRGKRRDAGLPACKRISASLLSTFARDPCARIPRRRTASATAVARREAPGSALLERFQRRPASSFLAEERRRRRHRCGALTRRHSCAAGGIQCTRPICRTDTDRARALADSA